MCTKIRIIGHRGYYYDKNISSNNFEFSVFSLEWKP